MFTPLRSRTWNPGNGGGETFVLFAFVTDVTSQDVTEGMDSTEHMSDFFHEDISSIFLSV